MKPVQWILSFLVLLVLSTSCGLLPNEPKTTSQRSPVPTPVYENPASEWKLEDLQRGAPAGGVRSLQMFDNVLYAGTDNGLFSFDGKSWKKWANTVQFGLINDISVWPGDKKLRIATDALNDPSKHTGVHRYDGEDADGNPIWTTEVQHTTFSFSRRVDLEGSLNLVAATFGGIFEMKNGTWARIYDREIGGQGRFHAFFQTGFPRYECAASLDAGVFCVKQINQNEIIHFHKDAASPYHISSNNIRYIMARNPVTLIGTEGGGIALISEQVIKVGEELHELPVEGGTIEQGGAEVSWFDIGPDYWLYQATFDKGLVRIDDDIVEVVDPTPANTVMVLGEVGDSELIVLSGTRENGLKVIPVKTRESKLITITPTP